MSETASVKLKHQLSGNRNGTPWPAPGTVVELPADEAAQLVRIGMAEEVEEERAVPDQKDVETRGTARKAPAKKPAATKAEA